MPEQVNDLMFAVLDPVVSYICAASALWLLLTMQKIRSVFVELIHVVFSQSIPPEPVCLTA